MVDSDEEYNQSNANNQSNLANRKNRDKFYRERDDVSNNNSNSTNYNRDRRDWNNDNRSNNSSWKNNRNNNYPRKYQTSPRYETSPPPSKRNKKDWMDSLQDQKPSLDMPDYPTQPPFYSFKQFLQQQDDSISDEEAIKRYNEYKLDFKKTQINNFFLEHKEEDWFKQRFHPDENARRRNEQNHFILNRMEVFLDLMNKGWLNDASVEADHSKDLTRYLDAFVIKLEGGTDKDLKQFSSMPTKEQNNLTSCNEDGNKEDGHESETNQNGEPSHKSKVKRERSQSRERNSNSGSESGAYTDTDDESKRKSSSNTQITQNSNSGKNLHKTTSIFMRNLSPTVTKEDLENLCKNYDGFKRVALSDPAPERNFFRRGWITFESNVDVKKICWNLQNVKIKDCNPGAIVNRELTSRIRPINNLCSHHKSVVKNDIRLAMKIIENMDKKWNLWQDKSSIEHDEDKKTEVEPGLNGSSETPLDENQRLEEEAFKKLPQQKFLQHNFNGINPLLVNITDYLVDEANAEEEELLGDSKSKSNNLKSFDIEIDKNYNKILDKLILYLRTVYSIDFYNATEYQQEDSMPNRCGIMFVRPALPPNAASASLKVSQEEINQYQKQFESKLKPFVDYKDKIDLDFAIKLGIKDLTEEIEKFVKVNTQELAPDRWLCPLSGKRFKGPEFIRKHLFYKHMEKIIELKKEVQYFNNYIFDPKRPQLPEHPSNKLSITNTSSTNVLSNHQQQYSHNITQQNYHQPINQSSYQNMPGLIMPPIAPYNASQMPFGPIANRSYSGSFDSMLHQGAYGGNFHGFQGSIPNSSGFNVYNQGVANYKKFNPNFNARRGLGSGGGGAGREMIQYRDLDAPEES